MIHNFKNAPIITIHEFLILKDFFLISPQDNERNFSAKELNISKNSFLVVIIKMYDLCVIIKVK